MNIVVTGTINAMQIAGSLGGVPYIGTVATLAQAIQTNIDKVATHKKDCQRIAAKVATLITALEPATFESASPALRAAADEAEGALRKVYERTSEWAQYRRLSAFLKDSKITDGILQCNSELDTAIQNFNITAHITGNHTQQQILDAVRLVREENKDAIQNLLHMLSNPHDVQQIADLERSGENVAAVIMTSGQLQLRQMRESQRRMLLEQPQSRQAESPRRSDDRIASSAVYAQTYAEYERGLSRLHTCTGILPSVQRLDGEVKREGDIPISGGTYSDVWHGSWLGDQKVALKALRGVKVSSDKAQERFEREVKVWANLQHPNILKFLGIVTDIGYFVHMVSPWQDNGNVLDYLRKVPDANRLHLLSGAAQGLEYLHLSQVVHGNLKCANILVSAKGEACICDFGMSKVMEDVTQTVASATLTRQGSSARWLAPELMDGNISSPTVACDIYSFSMTMYECVTGKPPFAAVKHDVQVIHKVVTQKLRPPRPSAPPADRWVTDEFWALINRCWDNEPDKRPPMDVVASEMRRMDAAPSRIPREGDDHVMDHED